MRQRSVEMPRFFFGFRDVFVDVDVVVIGGHPHKAQKFAQCFARRVTRQNRIRDD